MPALLPLCIRRLQSRSYLRAAILAVCAILGTACTPKNDNKGITLHHFRSAAHKTLDPMQQFDSASAQIIANVYDSLLEYAYLKRPYSLEANLLTEVPKPDATGKVYILKLRQNVFFHDDACFAGGKGRKLNADDVIYSIKRFANANVNVKSYTLLQGMVAGLDAFRAISKVKGKAFDPAKHDIIGLQRIDSHSIRLMLTQATPLALFPFATSQLSIVPQEAVEHYGAEFARHPVGTGPFTIQTYARRGEMLLKKYPRYHGRYPQGGPDAGKPLPLVDWVHLPLIEEPQPAMLRFRKGELDWIGLDRDNFTKMATKDAQGNFKLKSPFAEQYHMYTEAALYSGHLVINMKDPLLGANKALRQAIAYAMDTQRWIEEMRNGRGQVLKSIVPHSIQGSEQDIDVPHYAYSLAQAEAKLVEAGYPKGKGLPPIVIEYRSTSVNTRQDFEFLRNQLAKIGIVAKGNFQTFSAFLQRIESGNFQIIDAAWGADFPDAENFYQLLYGKNLAPGPNQGSYQNDAYDALYLQSKNMPNGPKRFALFAKMAQIIHQDVPLIPTWTPLSLGLYQPWIGNMKRNMMVDAPYKYLRVDAHDPKEAPQKPAATP